LSPDQEFSPKGVISGIEYKASFIEYKAYLGEDTTTVNGIIAYYNQELFGLQSRKPTRSASSATTSHAIHSALDQLRRDTADPVAEEVPPPPSPRKSPVQPEDNSIPAPTSPTRSEHHVSISITSNVSHTVTASSRVSNTTGNDNSPAPEYDTEEGSPPPSPKAPKPTRNKKASKRSKTTNTPSSDLVDAPATTKKQNSTKQEKAPPKAASSGRSLRTRK
jgi:hypothetical protein